MTVNPVAGPNAGYQKLKNWITMDSGVGNQEISMSNFKVGDIVTVIYHGNRVNGAIADIKTSEEQRTYFRVYVARQNGVSIARWFDLNEVKLFTPRF